MADRVDASCSGCGASFSRSVFNPYLLLCPACRRPSEAPPRPPVAPEEAQAAFAASARALHAAADGDDSVWLSSLAALRTAAAGAKGIDRIGQSVL